MLEPYPDLETCKANVVFTAEFILHDGQNSKLFAKTHLGLAIAGFNHKIGSGVVPDSYLYICPTCGWNWAEIKIQHPGSTWDVYRKPCSQHGWGSMLSWVPTGYTTYEYPYEILEREFLLMLDNPKME